MKRFFSIFFVAVAVLFLSTVNITTAEVFINYFPEDVTINEGAPVDVPVFFEGNGLAGKPVELLIWTETVESSQKEYLGPGGWIPFTDAAAIQPVFYLGSMIEYANLMWRAFENTTGMASFTLNICMKDVETGSQSCGQRKINITPAEEPPPTPACTGLSVSPTSISKSLKRGTSETIQVAVKDSCGAGIDFNASSAQGWIGLAKQTGMLAVTLNSGSLTVGTHYGSVDVVANGTSAKVNVTLSVTSPTFDFPVCTSSSVSIWPVSITAASGETAIKSVAITDNCGKALSYTATESVTWLTAQASGTGTMQLTANTAGMTAGTYTGAVQISPAGFSPVTLTVTLTITGICEPASAVITPASISKSVTAGMNATDAIVTIKDNCGGNLAYTVTAVSGTWMSTVPSVNIQGTGTLTVKFNTSGLSVGSYNGSITLNLGTYGTKTIPVTVTVSTVSTGTVLLKNFEIQYFSYPPAQVRYFYFHENSSKGLGNNNPLVVSQMDMKQSVLGDVDMLVKYAGVNCELGLPTSADYTAAKNTPSDGTLKTVTKPDGSILYFRMSSTAFETVEIPAPNPQGCYYVMVVNGSSIFEDSISIKYEDSDSNM